MENVTLEPELEEALASATDAELCDIAGDGAAFVENSGHTRAFLECLNKPGSDAGPRPSLFCALAAPRSSTWPSF